MIRILIADDHAVVRQGLTQILAQIPEAMVAGESTTGEQTLKKLRSESFDLVIMDISMPGRSGLELLRSVKEEFAAIPVLVLSMHPEELHATQVFKAGGSGYLNKESAGDELTAAIRKVAKGGRYVSAALAARDSADSISHGERRAARRHRRSRGHRGG